MRRVRIYDAALQRRGRRHGRRPGRGRCTSSRSTLNDNLPEIYLWQPNYLHVYSDRLGGGFAIYPNERESFKKILDWTLRSVGQARSLYVRSSLT